MQSLGRTRLSRGISRSLTLLPGLFALLTAYSCAQSNVSGPCADGLTACGRECADLRTDSSHCGACDSACATGTACEAGACAGGCVAGFLDCGNGCIDPQTDAHDCGACGLACAGGAACEEGVCGVACPEGYSACDDVCVDLQSTARHCGSCDTPCPPQTFCIAGQCEPCAAGLTQCGARCVDLQADAQHCGGCETRCAGSLVCVDGVCGDNCPAGQGLCNGVCISLQASNDNCGACGTVCGPGTQCSGGLCQSRCAAGQLFCAGQCIDVQTNALHCSACFASCPLDFACVDGACANPCADGLEPCSGACVDLMTDPANCGSCYTACAGTLVCGSGVCGCGGDVVCSLCGTLPLDPRVPQTVTGDTTSGLDSYDPGCGFGDGNELSYAFTAPTNGSYNFSLAGSSFDTLLALTSSACTEIICNDDTGGRTSQVATTLRSGQTVYVVVDGYGGATGPFTLNITGGLPCTSTDLGSTVPQTVTGTTAGVPDALTPSCGAFGGREVRYTFTAPADGSYTFDTVGSAFNTVLHVRSASCVGPELACNDDTGGLQSEVTVTLTAGQVVLVAVDGASAAASGAFTLNIH